ncbi:SUKH-3 domain-containing protein [Actinoplanes sp. NPDC049802]|uniref:SUKH-3 domain-containing protein n=1 Tax=Actinoplanes sp. NPDC049802 TaxID=3154742 RepID=UPI0033EBD305
MITLAEARQIATGWAHRQTVRRGYPCTPQVDELTLGYAVWMRLPPEARTGPGEDVITVIDRETGRLSHWPPAPPGRLDERYTARRDAAVGSHQTSDPVAELRREAYRRVSPSVAAHFTTADGRLFRARGAKGDQELRHHPLVAGKLAAIAPGGLVRGAERHAELLVVSDVLYDTGTVEGGHFATFHIRESGDPKGGEPAKPCATCSDVLLALGVIGEDERTYRKIRRLDSGTDPQPGRFPPDVAWELAAEGWEFRPQRERRAAAVLRAIEESKGAEYELRRFPAAEAAFLEFYDVAPNRNCPGVAQRVRWFEIGTGAPRHLADPLHELGQVVGARMFPLGREGFDEAVLAIDEHGRVFSLDQGGEWFLGETVDEAIVALLTGLPAARIRDDGTWSRL